MADSNWILIYEYVEGMIEKRTPYRTEHLERVTVEREAGRLLIAGAYGDPPSGAVFGFKVAGREQVVAFAAGDPYVEAGLVTKQTIEPWNLI